MVRWTIGMERQCGKVDYIERGSVVRCMTIGCKSLAHCLQ